ncbi:GTP-binding protein TypA [Candidatus Falkowbacteria bacterium RIFOXYB2_FULL_34_18]|uniref:50S ribosomal subunit assembly factor BipA n=1 Tax=Candidatus Falkowbacteria bacterium RIFOXYD2_FULL_34_120 TaxID=1798007 RepID=A0A1F5TPL3_9BACT|nr:MAG: GTP-binding protein TypA [Candidatus Falkowbacteria bacterium RIFOXYB2_FULL_34_18]OGF29262.1 MAG: GTP-binding protein TypA [Candidatus Falkowbacteria bacterium RIFOXYC12_FULL_34_55]OGF36378.1 MAG: GTP-binding protein TypA [Candidatus Falkowbacteria bacterium RIFOXYC2_FULL_34_220]OGF38857.1 MAG: GTP-binding protein TypA [Candidatus Falkowbacteria bacterium RIFOXYD12_FULL_34_57]OGF40876.1 MAG: GTP-binding protein TypA [Candidatus Falkowbacteria bacterium RIFOXYD2_FULL_34_120]
MDIRNIAIIAHVDHGKTTLTDALMQQTGMASEGVSMDSNALEQERGITIYSKNTSVYYKNTKINIVDTPGHADFGSEVERVLRSIDSVLLVVDAQEGPMPQTKFVLKKSLDLGLKPIVVINKIDKPAAMPLEAQEMVYELFLDLGASDAQLNFTSVYTIARQGLAKINLEDASSDLTPLLDIILEKVPIASSDEANNKPLRVQPFNLGYDNFLGRLAVGRIYEGKINKTQNVFIKNSEGKIRTGKISKLFTFEGLNRKEVETVEAGDIVMIAGLPDIYIGETICEDINQEMLPAINIDEPTISLNFLINNSPFAGREGKFVTNRQLQERLRKELEINVGLKIDFSAIDHYKVCGRGEMHIAILLENMRREGYEIQISQPHVIIKEVNGEKQEPFEEVTINVPEEMSGIVIEKLSKRHGNMLEMKPEHANLKIVFEIPTRGLLGYRNEFVVDTRGEGIIYTRVIGFKPFVGHIQKYEVGSMVSMATGKALGFSLFNLQDRGTLYIGATTEVYEGMVIGNVAKGNDLNVNPTKGKQLTNMRASGADEAIRLTPPTKLTLEKGMGIMNEDEYLEITPKNIRLRKQKLKETDRIKDVRAKKK